MAERHVLVTGGTGGLGGAVTRAFLGAGAHVVVPVFRAEEGEALVASLEPHARSRLVLNAADLRDEPSVIALIEAMPELHAVVHLVGGFAMGPIEACTVETAQEQLELNVMAAFLVIKHAVARMRREGHGRIVTIGSRSGVEPAAQQAIYSASKAALVALTKAVAAETRGTDITANCVLPSVIDTPANRAAMGDANAATWVKPESLAEVVVFLASEAARDVRGAAVPVYGSA
jgi:NAD(P)-dependent dehydrogenase (short-subunit alcohol dehydrogenase family)